MRRILAALLFILLAGQALAEQRYALLIGNEDYPATVGPLNNPHEDVARIKSALIAAGFPAKNIVVETDATQSEINLAVAGFSSKLKKAGNEGIGFFYYSGHGGSAEASGVRANYLIPAKTPLTGSEQLPILGVPMNGLIDSLAAANAKAVFVVSDACRNTLPFTSTKGGATDKGMVRVLKRSGLFIAYATADGATAPDDGSFSRALAKHLKQKGLTADRAFTLAFREVAKRRPGNALPFSTDGLLEDFCFSGCALPPPPVTLSNNEAQALSEALSSGDLQKLYEFERRWPSSKNLKFVRAEIAEITNNNVRDSGVAMFMSSKPETPDWAKGLTGDAAVSAKACLTGSARQCTALGFDYRHGTDGAPKNLAYTRALYEKGCDGGNMDGCHNLSILYRDGLGVSADYSRARTLASRACDSGNMPGCNSLGYLYVRGYGVSVDYTRARTLYTKACDGGLMQSCGALASLHRNGRGGPVSISKARELHQKACRGGYQTSCRLLKNYD